MDPRYRLMAQEIKPFVFAAASKLAVLTTHANQQVGIHRDHAPRPR
jgi:hypothetical protein